MSHFLDRLRFFKRIEGKFSNGHGITTSEDRQWEDAYRNRWRFDKVVRSTHGVNCTGGCSWNIHVKNGLVAFEMQATDYPRTRADLPDHEPRGCQRGASYSWYLYSPHRVKYPLIRGRLLDLYRAERARGLDPVEAWRAIQKDPEKRRRYTAVRGLGGFVRAEWEELVEIIAAANVYTIDRYGPDRVIGFSPIPAMSMISYAAGTRYLGLIGGVPLSFYDWYCDLPPSSPQTWGEQTDVPEAADWYNAGYIICCGANLPMTRTPDAHFYSEVRYKGTKVVAIAPDYAEYVKFADLWMPVKQGTDSALFLAMGHVVLKEFFLDRDEAYFTEYARAYTDLPMLVRLRPHGDGYAFDRLVRASDFDDGLGEANNPDWKAVVLDEDSGEYVVPNGSIGFRWGEEGRWNLKLERDGTRIRPRLSLLGQSHEVVEVSFPDFEQGPAVLTRRVPTRKLTLHGQEVLCATVFDLQVAQYGVDRGLGGAHVAARYEDPDVPYTPAWAECVTGVKRADIIRTAREFADNAAKTLGKSMVILGAGINHWYHNDMTYRSIMNLLHLCGCVGQSGGGWAHYVGQEKLRPQAGWQPIAFALDWHRPARQMNGTSFWYFHTDQWRYERLSADSLLAPTAKGRYRGHTLADYNVVSQRLGWLPSAPHFNKNPLAICAEAEAAGAETEQEIVNHVVGRLKSGDGALRRRGHRRPRELAEEPLRVARQPPRHQRQGPRVFPQTPDGRPERRHAEPARGRQGHGDPLARRGADRQARPHGGHQLPAQLDRGLLGHRPAHGHLVREERSQHHRHAPLHPPPDRGREPGVGIEIGLADLPKHRPCLRRARREAPRQAQGPPGHPAHARLGLRARPGHGGARLETRGVRARPRKDPAAPQGRRARFWRDLQEVLCARPAHGLTGQ